MSRIGRITAWLCAVATRLAVPLDLPVAGLEVEVEEGPRWSVESAWGPDGGADWVLRDGQRGYKVTVAGRTARDCPMDSPDVVVIEGAPWIRSGATWCRLHDEARLLVERVGSAAADEEDLLASLGRSFEARRVGRATLPAPSAPVSREVVLPETGLRVTLPNDALWRFAPAGGDDHDGLVREVPALPEVQVVVRRHKRAELADCQELRRRLEGGGWRAVDISTIEIFSRLARNTFAGFESEAWCARRGDELLDVRVASRGRFAASDIAGLWRALAGGTSGAAPLPSVAAARPAPWARSVNVLATGGVLLVSRGESLEEPWMGALDIGASQLWRNGLALTARGRIGADAGGLTAGVDLGAGIAFAFSRDLALVLTLGWMERRDALIDNRALSLTVELHRGLWALDGERRWALRVMGIQLASEQPRVFGAPLEIGWLAEIVPGLVWGLGLRSVGGGLVGSNADAIEFGVSIGYGPVWR